MFSIIFGAIRYSAVCLGFKSKDIMFAKGRK